MNIYEKFISLKFAQIENSKTFFAFFLSQMSFIRPILTQLIYLMYLLICNNYGAKTISNTYLQLTELRSRTNFEEKEL